MLHVTPESCSIRAGPTVSPSPQSISDPVQDAVHSLHTNNAASPKPQVVLATARIMVRVDSGHSVIVRALLDQGSESSFISKSLAQTFHAVRIRMPRSISGVGGLHASTVQHGTRIYISSRASRSPSLTTTALILKRLTAYAPPRRIPYDSFEHLRDLFLSDPNPVKSDPIHLIIGVDLYGDVILDGIRKGTPGQPFA